MPTCQWGLSLGAARSVLAEGAAGARLRASCRGTRSLPRLISGSEEGLRGYWGSPVPEMAPVSLLRASSGCTREVLEHHGSV